MQTTVTQIYKGFSNSIARFPYAVPVYACGHGCEMQYRDQRGDRHSPDNWLIQVGAPADCDKCDQNLKAIEMVIAFTKTPEFSHITLRDMTASKTGEWMQFCAYRVDRSSPTQCNLAMGVEATPETERALREAGVGFLPGPSRGRMAMV
jgi:hypothetical protein